MLKSIFIRESSGKPYENLIKSRILSAITEKAIAETYQKKKAGITDLLVILKYRQFREIIIMLPM